MQSVTETPSEVTAANAPADPANLLADLRERFKVLADFRPLKIKIHLDIRAALAGSGTANVRIARAMHYHTGHGLYLKALADGGPRYNLAGEIEGEVTEEQRQRAREQIKQRHQGKKAAKRKAKPKPPAPLDPPAAPPDPEPAPIQAEDAPSARPVLRLKSKTNPAVSAAVVVRKEAKS